MKEEAIVKVEHLSHRYSVQWAVKDISFEIPEKGIYGLLGSNGAGKSTVMNIMCGVLKQTEGDVFVHGADTRKDPLEAKKHIGFLPQQAPLYTDMSVKEYLTHSAYLRRMPDNEIKAAVDEVLERCSITHFRDRLIKNLSGGDCPSYRTQARSGGVRRAYKRIRPDADTGYSLPDTGYCQGTDGDSLHAYIDGGTRYM